MKIDNIHIDGFGVWNDRTWEALGPGLNLFSGPNETGKSTLMAFIRAVLFGLDRRGSPRRYEPLNGGSHGGWLDLQVQDRQIRLERRSGRHVRGAVTVYEGDVTGSDAELEKLLSGTTRTLYHNVFAFGLEELEQFHTLQDTEVAQHISGATLGIGAARWSSVQRDLEARQSALFLPRGQTSAINVALKELEAVRDDLDRTEHQPEEYWAAFEAKVRVAAEVEGLEEISGQLKQRVAHYERRLKSRPLRERRKAIHEQLADLPAVESFPEGGVERLNLLRNQLRALQLERDGSRREPERKRLQRMNMKAMADVPIEFARRAQVIESLRTLLPRVDAARRVYAAAVEHYKAVKHEKEALDIAISDSRPPSQAAFFVFVGLIWCGGGGLVWVGQPYIAAALFAISLSPLLWYRQRLRMLDKVTEQRGACAERLQAAELELKTIENEARQIQDEIRRLTGRRDISQQDIDARVEELDRLSKLAEELRRLDDELERADADLKRADRQIEEHQDTIAALFAEASSSDEAEFHERAEVFKKRLQLLAELDRIPPDAPESGLLFDIRSNEEEACELAKAELADTERRLIEARHESGRIEERIAIMERSEERSRALARQEVILAKVDADAELWAVVTLCRTLLDETRRIYETERQPEVLRHASSFFKLMTEGRYTRVIAPLDGTKIQVERSDGVRLSPQLLSRGAAEQLYLAMRLALVRDYAKHVDPLPVVFDDVFVNFDPQRTRQTVLAVRELAQSHQVLLFTCHPHLVSLVQEIVPSARMFPLQ